MIKLFLAFVLFFTTSITSLHAQSLKEDTSAVYNVLIDVVNKLNPDKKAGDFDSFFSFRQQRYMYTTFMQALEDSGSIKVYPLEYLMGLRGGAKMRDMPKLMLRNARKNKNKAQYYIALNILFQEAEFSPSTSESKTTISLGKLTFKGDKKGMYLDMITKFTVYDAQGNKVHDFRTTVTSDEEIVLVKEDSMIIGKNIDQKSGFGDDAPAMSRFLRKSAMSVLEKLDKQ